MRTNIDINDQLLQSAMELTQSKTKKAIVELALKELVQSIKRRKVLAMEGNAPWMGNLTEMRKI
jgi:Arc/MetJ family transcription regulator